MTEALSEMFTSLGAEAERVKQSCDLPNIESRNSVLTQKEQQPKALQKSTAETDPASCPPTIQEQEFREAWRAVANAKLNEYRRQCWRLADLVRKGIITKQATVDHLLTIATAYALVRSLGEDQIETIIAETFAGTELDPLPSEVA